MLVSSISPTFFILKLHVLYFTVPLLSFLLRSQVLIFQCPRKRYLATWMQHLLQKDSKVFRYGNTVPVAVVWSKNGEEIWSLKKFCCLTCWWKQGGRSIGDERGKGGWGGGQMLLTLCTLTWVSIFSILYLYAFCSVLTRRICSCIKYSVLF